MSFSSVFNGKKLQDRALNWEFNNRKAVRDKDWLLLEQAAPYGNAKWQLFDRASDPSMKADVAEQHPKQVKKMIKQWQQYAKHVDVVKAPARYNYAQKLCFYGKCIGEAEK